MSDYAYVYVNRFMSSLCLSIAQVIKKENHVSSVTSLCTHLYDREIVGSTPSQWLLIGWEIFSDRQSVLVFNQYRSQLILPSFCLCLFQFLPVLLGLRQEACSPVSGSKRITFLKGGNF